MLWKLPKISDAKTKQPRVNRFIYLSKQSIVFEHNLFSTVFSNMWLKIWHQFYYATFCCIFGTDYKKCCKCTLKEFFALRRDAFNFLFHQHGWVNIFHILKTNICHKAFFQNFLYQVSLVEVPQPHCDIFHTVLCYGFRIIFIIIICLPL